MKLASISSGRNGKLAVVSADLSKAAFADRIAPTLQEALDEWDRARPELELLADEVAKGTAETFDFDVAELAAPLPRAYQWADGSAYVNHVELVRKARGAEMPESFWHDPLMYQGGSDWMLGPREQIVFADAGWGIDFEGELAVITGDVAAGCSKEEAAAAIRLVMLVNDVSLRNLIPGELAKGFGFFQSKPPTAFSPVAITLDELGDSWRDNKVHLPLMVDLNGEQFGRAEAGVDMVFDFADLIVHAAKTRPLRAGSIIGSGTVSNKDASVGSSCLAEKRMLEIIADGKPSTEFMRDGDVVRIDMHNAKGESLFGAIEQTVSIKGN